MIDYNNLRFKEIYIGKYMLVNGEKIQISNNIDIKYIKYIYNLINKDMFFIKKVRKSKIK